MMDANQRIELFKIGAQIIAAVVWPVVLACFLWIYRTHIGRFIDRLQKLGGSYFEASAGGQINQQEEKPSNLSELERIIPPDVIDLNLERTKSVFTPLLGSGKDREEAFFKIISSMSIAIHYHQVYALIFGSQLSLLFELNSKSVLPIAQTQPFYERAVQQNPEPYKTYSFEQWLGFLTSQGIIDTAGGMVSLTVYGRGLLNFVVAQKMSINKAL